MTANRASVGGCRTRSGLARRGRYVFLEVAHNGPGLEPGGPRARLWFDPPSASRKGGRDPSLAAVREIAPRHLGAVQVTESPDQGSAVRVLLPTADASRAEPASWAGIGPVLVVDDEETVSRLVVHMLASAALTAETVSGGAEALERLRADPHRYGLLFLVLGMPAPDGPMVLRGNCGSAPPLKCARRHHERPVRGRGRQPPRRPGQDRLPA